jgi:hypothetical protein
MTVSRPNYIYLKITSEILLGIQTEGGEENIWTEKG